MTILLTVIRPARVFIPLLSFKGIPLTHLGSADFPIRVLVDPESSRTLRNFLLLIDPMGFATAIVAGVHCLSFTAGSSAGSISIEIDDSAWKLSE